MKLVIKAKLKPRLAALVMLPLTLSVSGLLPQEGFDLLWQFSQEYASAQGNASTQENSNDETNLLTIQENSLLSLGNVASTSEKKAARQIRVVVTAYSSTPWETDDTPYITASGAFVREGIAANNLLPFGTQFRIPDVFGDRVFVVEDRLNSKKGYYHVDIWFPSRSEALAFGAKRTYIEVIQES